MLFLLYPTCFHTVIKYFAALFIRISFLCQSVHFSKQKILVFKFLNHLNSFFLVFFRSVKRKYKSFPQKEVSQKQAQSFTDPLAGRFLKEHLLSLSHDPSDPFRALPPSTLQLLRVLKVSVNSFRVLDKDLTEFCKLEIPLSSKSGHNISTWN